jgi:pimeloyl-ACP methyl ester carboxylesterase
MRDSPEQPRSAMTPTQHEFQGPKARLTYFEWGTATASAPTVLLVHATGFHARCWDQVVAALPAGTHVIAPDMRGHGRSEKVEPYEWDSFGDDLKELVAYLGLEGAVGVGHSMGGHCVTQVAAAQPGVLARLLLLDPVILPPEAYEHERYPGLSSPADHPVAKRKGRWRDWQEMFARFEHREPFSRWRREVLEDYCRYGVLPAADGDGFELACPGIVEASVYFNNTQTNVHDLLGRVDVPVLVLRARQRDPEQRDVMDFSVSPTWPELAAHLPDARDVYLPELTHFIPMQAPELVAGLIVDPNAEIAVPGR